MVVAQSGGPTAAINSSLAGIVEAASRDERIGHLYGARFGADGLLLGDFLDLGAQDPGIWSRIRITPSAALGSCRRRVSADDVQHILETLKRHEVRYLLYIGGNDSADTALALDRAARSDGYELGVIAVPKTIDNDLPGTDHCPGYGSAARYLAQSTQDSGLDTEAMRRSDPVKLIEVMGRDAGWLAAASVLGKNSPGDAPHVVCVPERPLDMDAFIGAIEDAYSHYGFALAIVAETVRDTQGRAIGGLDIVREADAFGHPAIQGTAAALASAVGRALGIKARFDKPGTLQRMSGSLLSSVDIEEAYEAGAAAARLALEGISACMVGFERLSTMPYRCRIITVPLAQVANQSRALPEMYLGSDPFGIAAAFVEYATPLIGPSLLPYARLAMQ
jgi:6-phosphofructokinase